MVITVFRIIIKYNNSLYTTKNKTVMIQFVRVPINMYL